MTIYHLLLFDGSARRILVERVGARWLAPILRYSGLRGHQAEVLPAAAGRLGITAWPVHDAPVNDAPVNDAGDDAHAYCAFVVEAASHTHHGEWIPLDDAMQTSPGPRVWPLFEVQRRALARCVKRFEHPTAPLDSPRQVNAGEAWALTALAAHGYARTGAAQVLRHTRTRRVMKWPTRRGDVYLKMNAESVHHEARVTRALAARLPEQFVHTIDLNPTHGWWLYEGMAGEPLVADQLTADLGARVGTAIARIQRLAASDAVIAASFGSCRASAEDLLATARLARGLVERFADTDERLAALHDEDAWDGVAEACRTLGTVPCSFVHADLWLQNILDRGDALGLIDAEDSVWGPVVLTLSHPLAMLRAKAVRDVSQQVIDAYVDEWRAGCAPTTLRSAVRTLDVVSRLWHLKRRLDRDGLSVPAFAERVRAVPYTARLAELLAAMLKSSHDATRTPVA